MRATDPDCIADPDPGDVAVPTPKAICQQHDDAVARQGNDDDGRIAQAAFDPISQQESDRCCRDRANAENQSELRFTRLVLKAHELAAPAQQLSDIFLKIGTNGDQRAKMHGDIKRQSLVAPAENRRHEDEMT